MRGFFDRSQSRPYTRRLLFALIVISLGCVLSCGGLSLALRTETWSIPRTAFAFGPFVVASDEAGVRQIDKPPPLIRYGQTREYMLMTVAVTVVEERRYWIVVLALRRWE